MDSPPVSVPLASDQIVWYVLHGEVPADFTQEQRRALQEISEAIEERYTGLWDE